MIRTSLTHPIQVQFLPPSCLEMPGQLGITFAPGKQAPSMFGSPWKRDLELDLQRLIEVYQTDCLVSLLEEWEYQEFQIADLRDRARALGMQVLHLPIPDGRTPPDPDLFSTVIAAIIAELQAGHRVVVHCRGGLGRAGTITAAVLITLGYSASAAMQQVRATRPGAIENKNQETFLVELAQSQESS